LAKKTVFVQAQVIINAVVVIAKMEGEIKKNNIPEGDTIVAIATPPGKGGIGIVRISGVHAIDIAQEIFIKNRTNRDPKVSFGRKDSHRMIHGYIINKHLNQIIDEVLICPMVGPKTYTREDVVEIHAHSNQGILNDILDITLREGANMAQPGEFTKRAFLNGRIDLTQAEAVMDIINARSHKAREIAAKQITGELKHLLHQIRENIEQAMAVIEMGIDFIEVENNDCLLENNISHQWRKNILEPITDLVNGSKTAIMYKEGVQVAIVGKPNVGKSSILNRLIQKERAIVSEYPGTTRDIVSESIDINGIIMNLVDTAGIHSTRNTIEKLGIIKSQEAIEKADIVIFVTDSSRENNEADYKIYELIKNKTIIWVQNKCDLVSSNTVTFDTFKNSGIKVSALTGLGIEEIRNEMIKTVMLDDVSEQENYLISTLRQKKCLKDACTYLSQAITGYENGIPLELIAMDFKEGRQKIDEITGNHYHGDLLDTIFSTFCVGK
jgi:tRNA modification GTPase